MRSLFIILIMNGFIISQENTTNGFLWSEWNMSMRKIYIDGFMSGIYAGETSLQDAENSIKQRDPYWLSPLVVDINIRNLKYYNSFLNSLSMDEIVLRINAFYSDPDNIEINVNDAIKIINMRASSDTEKADKLLIFKGEVVLKV